LRFARVRRDCRAELCVRHAVAPGAAAADVLVGVSSIDITPEADPPDRLR
jgi:hypothetical protein